MKGHVKIVNSADDLALSEWDKEKVIEMATISVRRDTSEYPDDYDAELKDGDDGFIEPEYVYNEEIDQAVLDRFGGELKLVVVFVHVILNNANGLKT